MKLAQKCKFALNYIPTSFRVTYYDNFGIRVKMWNYHFIIFKFREGNKNEGLSGAHLAHLAQYGKEPGFMLKPDT